MSANTFTAFLLDVHRNVIQSERIYFVLHKYQYLVSKTCFHHSIYKKKKKKKCNAV